MKFVPDIDRAKKQVIYSYFSEYSPAYVVTNENLRTIKDFMPQNCNRALTVAWSGDHPLFCSLYGAKYVDTFDVTINAECITWISRPPLSNC